MKKDKINIDEFFKEYVDSLPESNFSGAMEERLKNSIFEKVSQNRAIKVEKRFSGIFDFIISTKYIYPKIAFASLLIGVSIYFILRNGSTNNIPIENKIVKQDLNKNSNNQKKDHIMPNNDGIKYDETIYASLNYDFTSRSLDNNPKNNANAVVSKIIFDVFKTNGLTFTLDSQRIISEKFIYKDKVSELRIIIDDKKKEIIFNLLTRKINEFDDISIKINPKVLIDQVESNLLSLLIIE